MEEEKSLSMGLALQGECAGPGKSLCGN